MSDDVKRFDRQNEPPQWARVLNFLLLAFVIFYAIQLVSQSGSPELTYNEFKDRVTSGKVAEVTIEGHQVTGMMEDAGGSDDPSGRQIFRSYIPEVGETRIVDLLEQNGVTIRARESGPDLLSRLLVSFLPWLTLIGLMIFFWQRMQRQMGGGQQSGGLFNMGKSKAKRFSRDEPGKTFRDIAGSDNAKKDLTEIVDYLKHPDFYQRLGAKLPRGAGVGGGHDEREQTLNQILSEMDGFSPHETVVVIAATNRPDVLDPALLRPGRFDRKVTLDRPHKKAREKILEIHTKAMPLADDVNLAAVARRTVGFSGADLENLANEAALFAGRDDSKVVRMQHFDMARDKVLMGAKREQNLSDDEKKVIAFHESGHALTALLFPKADALEKVTIIPRGRALGLTEQAPDEDRLNMTASYARDRIAVMLGGRTSEQLIFNEVSSGAENDIEQATKLARRMVSRWGMSEVIGPMSVSSSQEEVFLGHEISREREFSEATAEKVDDEVRKLITDIEKEVNKRLKENRNRLERLANTLFEEETLEASEIASLLDIRVSSEGRDGELSRDHD